MHKKGFICFAHTAHGTPETMSVLGSVLHIGNGGGGVQELFPPPSLFGINFYDSAFAPNIWFPIVLRDTSKAYGGDGPHFGKHHHRRRTGTHLQVASISPGEAGGEMKKG